MRQRMAGGVRLRVDAMSATAPGYDVVVRHGAIAELPARVATAAPAAAYAVITPHTLRDTLGSHVLGALRAAGLRAELLGFDDGERAKTRDTWADLTDRMLELKLGRDSCVIAVGGGVTGDVAGFVAATYMRGVPFVQVPTTLLAMIDASVGGKTGVDTPAGKNLVGAFHAPSVVIVDPAVLRTLPPRQVRSGLAEAVKHGAIIDAAYFHWIAENAGRLLTLDAAALELFIARSIELKAEIVSADPLEAGRRAVLNFGHTVAHALELHTGYAMPHGFAVAVGMCTEAALGEELGITQAGTAESIRALCAHLELPARAAFEPRALLHAMIVDKKARGSRPRFVLLRELGECASDPRGAWTHDVDVDALLRVLHRCRVGSDLV